jgi:hypothetical protein
LFVRPVTFRTALYENWLDIAFEVDRIIGGDGLPNENRAGDDKEPE